MSCKDFEQNIYVYHELSTDEKKLVDTHLQTCSSCAALFEELKQTQLLIEQMANEAIVPKNAARLTSGIMSKISTEKINRVSIFSDLLLGRARIALTCLSVVLLVAFAVEFLQDTAQLKATQSLVVDNSVVLNSKIFRDNFSQGKVKHSLFADCGSPLKIGQSYLDCMRSKLK